jgi:hypothetical protein
VSHDIPEHQQHAEPNDRDRSGIHPYLLLDTTRRCAAGSRFFLE